jgi:methylthioxylose transferase
MTGWPRREIALAAGVAAFLVLVATDVVPLLRGPAPYPPEWQWEYRTLPTSGRPLWAVLSAAGLVGLIALTGRAWAARRPSLAMAVLLLGATVGGFSYQLGLLDLEPGGALPTLLARTVSRTDTSYYTVAVSEHARDARDFLDRYAELLPALRQTGKHAATHPPGPVLYYRALIALTERWPALTRAALAAAGGSPDDRRVQRPPHSPASMAAAVIGGSLLLLLCAAACWPVALLARAAGCEALAATRLGLLWTLLPGPALMSPQFDQALALPVAAAVALLAAAVVAQDRRVALCALAAGLLAGVAFFVSYGATVFVDLGGLAAFALAKGPGRVRRWARVAYLAAAGFLAVIGLSMALGHEPVASLRTALAFHRDAYTAPRSYALWLAFDPLDLAVFLGLPVAALGLAALGRDVRRLRTLTDGAGRFRVVMALGLALLILSGTVRGEVGRIWIPLMPALLVAALAGARAEEPTARQALVIGAMLSAVGLALRTFWILP